MTLELAIYLCIDKSMHKPVHAAIGGVGFVRAARNGVKGGPIKMGITHMQMMHVFRPFSGGVAYRHTQHAI